MSLICIQQFQNKIYNALAQSAALGNVGAKTYIGPVHNAKPPFLSIIITKVVDKSVLSKRLYEIDFTISIFAKDKNYTQLLVMSDLVTHAIGKIQKINREYKLLGAKVHKIDFVTAKDLVTHKADIYYHSSIANRG